MNVRNVLRNTEEQEQRPSERLPRTKASKTLRIGSLSSSFSSRSGFMFLQPLFLNLLGDEMAEVHNGGQFQKRQHRISFSLFKLDYLDSR
jgi:hypothetical protein